ncbi:MAG TPA: glycosyltransferase, partial [Planctomycetota bacterium]|nr:glycosyltransferase [Planctomycetota bacterium]
SDRCDDLRRCLRELQSSLAEAGTPATEVLTVHAPHDATAMAMVQAEFPWVAVHRAAERHLSKQRNLGAQKARGAILVYLDDDAWPRRGWLAALSAAFADDRVVAASGPVYRGDGSLQCARLAASPLGRLVPIGPEQPLPRGMSPSFSGCNLAIRRSALFACGGFDENLCYQPDDMDVCWRLFARAGRSPDAMRYVATAAVNHESSPGPFRRTLHDRAWFTVARDNTYFAFRHAGPFRAMLAAAPLQLPKLARFVVWLVARKLGPVAFLRCIGKLVAGTIAGYCKGLSQTARLPLQALPPTPGPTGAAAEARTPQPTEERASCPPQPV